MSIPRGNSAHRSDQARRQKLYELVGTRIQILRSRENLKRATLAKLIGCSPHTLEGYEMGGAPPLHILVAIAEELDCTLDYFVEDLNAEERAEFGEVA